MATVSEEITICCRQEDSMNVAQNGVFSSTLAKPVRLNPGDSVEIKSAFLDTTDIISIPPQGLDISLTGMKYLVNYNINQKFRYRVDNTSIPAGGLEPLCEYVPTGIDSTDTDPLTTVTGDNQLYWLSEAYTTGTHNAYFLVNVNVFPTGAGKGGGRYGNGQIDITYTSPQAADNAYDIKTSVHCPNYEERDFQKHFPLPLPQDAHKTKPTNFYQFAVKRVNGVPQIKMYTPTGAFTPGSVQDLAQHHISHVEFPIKSGPITPVEDSYIMMPQYFTWNATVPGGKYTPQEIAAWLTDHLVPVELNGPTSVNYNHNDGATPPLWSGQTEFPSESPFLETLLQNERTLDLKTAASVGSYEQVFINASPPDGVDGPVGQLSAQAGVQARRFNLPAMRGDYKKPETGPPIVEMIPPVDRFVGTDQISVSFDENERKLKFDIMHFPIYTNSTVPTGGNPNNPDTDAQPGVVYNQLDTTSVNNERVNGIEGIAKAYSGVAFTAMNPFGFWGSQLGFSDNTVIVEQMAGNCGYPEWLVTSDPPTNNSFKVHNVVAGKTITQGLCGLSVPVVTTSAPQYPSIGDISDPATYKPPGPPGGFAQPLQNDGIAGEGAQITDGDVTAVFADKTYNDNLQEAGYFLIDISNNFQVDFVSENTRTQVSNNPTNGANTMSVVSRYYTSNSFVSDEGQGSVIYTHSGAPQDLTELSIRIKNPDGTFVGDVTLGNQNTVFLKITRSEQLGDGGALIESVEAKEAEEAKTK